MQSFTELPISPYTQERLAASRFTSPTPVQAAVIPQALQGKDVLATAQTGTGKTLAFVIPIMEYLLKQNTPGIAGLVVATPGRLEDFLGRKLIGFPGLRVLIIDEADRMLDMGFLPAIRRITAVLPRDRQTMCF